MRDISNKPPAEQSAHFELRVVRPDGSVLYVDNLVIITLGEDGKPVYIHGTSQDITEKKELQKEAEKAQKRILHLSTHDQLTGLPNKISFDNRSDILTKSALGNNASFAIIMLDIDTLLYVKNILDVMRQRSTSPDRFETENLLRSGEISLPFSTTRFVIILEGTYPMEDYENS